MIWLTILPFCMSMAILLTDWAWKALSKEVENSTTEPCAHPWYIDGRCMVCGTPKP